MKTAPKTARRTPFDRRDWNYTADCGCSHTRFGETFHHTRQTTICDDHKGTDFVRDFFAEVKERYKQDQRRG